MKTIHQTAVVAVSVAVAFIGFVSTVHAEARITSASKSASFAKTLRAAGSVSPNRRRLEEVVDDTIPTTCTDIPNGYEAFGVAAEDAFNSRNFEDDCHTMTGTEETIQDPIDDVYPSIQETTRVELCISNDQSTRYIFSNGLPDHPVVKSVNRPTHCIVPYAVALPTNPVYDATYLEETPIAGPMAFTVTNGIPIVDTAWAMRNGFLFSEEAWRGHANVRAFYWHYHISKMPPNGDYPAQDELVGYAMDGFAIYGPLSDSAVSRQGQPLVLDECNGLVGDDGVYRYHMIRMEEIDFTAPMCNEQDSRVHNWKPVLGCFRGSTANSRVWMDDGNRDGMTCQTILDGGLTSDQESQQPPPAVSPAAGENVGNLVVCLESISNVNVIDANNAETYFAASQCHNSARADRVWNPKAIVKVNTVEQVAEAVKCAVAANVKVTPRSGAHGFENEACSGELIIDVSGLESLELVDEAAQVVAFGSGHLHGQLYKKLSENYGWVVPGGTENSVGTAGLWLGCGRGPLTQVHGFTCDNVLEVEFVDATGNVRVANENQNANMYWIARGGGGEFPGIVTKFTVQAYDQPTEVWTLKIAFQSSQTGALIRAWSERLEALSNPAHSMFIAVIGFKGTPLLSMTCFSCDDSQREFMKQQFDEITSVAGGGEGYNEWLGTWIDRLLQEDWDAYETVEDLAVKPEWPEVWATLANGGHLVHSSEETSDAMLGVLQNALETYGDEFYLYLYSMISTSSNTLLDTAWGGRDAQYIVHYKWIGSDTAAVKASLRQISIDLDGTGLQCKGFYNYADRSFPCTGDSGEAWLDAHFSDVSRMRSIREAEDPNQLFVSNFKMQKWDTNKQQFVGFPEVGDWGGTCACPNGSVYRVGDNGDACETLACIGGVSGTCSEANAGGEGYRVTCDTSITVAPSSTETTTGTAAPAPVSAPTASDLSPVSSPVATSTTGGGTGTVPITTNPAPSSLSVGPPQQPVAAPLAFLPPNFIASAGSEIAAATGPSLTAKVASSLVVSLVASLGLVAFTLV